MTILEPDESQRSEPIGGLGILCFITSGYASENNGPTQQQSGFASETRWFLALGMYQLRPLSRGGLKSTGRGQAGSCASILFLRGSTVWEFWAVGDAHMGIFVSLT
jgi:hypothetical protein